MQMCKYANWLTHDKNPPIHSLLRNRKEPFSKKGESLLSRSQNFSIFQFFNLLILTHGYQRQIKIR